ncbi:transmembrane protein 201 homolog [Palaemon carinicauda]|uniref:transmembrane protein 201 homolog n=1 Tax=Palaemon carinicauda TaxID=392227 RepID=UPI0035B6A147
MDYDMILPAIAGASGLFAGFAVLYSKIRPRWLVPVNCWFCNKDTKVEYRHSDGWMCPSCHQYNGFTEEGDYNRDIPAQYCESLNHTCQRKDRQVKNQPSLALGNGFCQTCNLNQTLKVRALAEYTPIHPENYDHEIDEYKKRLERTYALCRQCEATLHQTIGKQDSWLKPKLISWRLKQSAENKTQVLNNNVSSPKIPFYLRLVRVLAASVSLCILLSNIHRLQHHSGVQIVSLDLGIKGEIYLTQIGKFQLPLVILGLTMVLLAIFGAGKHILLISDAITSFTWVGLLALTSSKKLLPSEDYNSLQVLISSAAVLLTFWTVLVPRSFNNLIMTKAPLNKTMRSDISSSRHDESRRTVDSSLSDDLRDLTAMPTPGSRDLTSTPIPPKSNLSSIDANIDSGLESLKISTPYKTGIVHPSTPFSPRALFSDKPGYNPKINDTYCIQRNVTPPRINTKNITQSSWVAGGYWGSPISPSREFSAHIAPKPISLQPNPVHVFPLSRSSSQSSGYISLTSGLPPYSSSHGPFSLPNSCHGSVCGDFERGSVFSEPAYKTWVPPVNIKPSDSVSQCSYGRGQARSDAQSLYSCASGFSGPLLQKTPPSPTGSTTCLFQDAMGSASDNSNFSMNSRSFDNRKCHPQKSAIPVNDNKGSSFGNQRSPWFAFFLGMSCAANGFLVMLLLSHSGVNIFGYKLYET